MLIYTKSLKIIIIFTLCKYIQRIFTWKIHNSNFLLAWKIWHESLESDASRPRYLSSQRTCQHTNTITIQNTFYI